MLHNIWIGRAEEQLTALATTLLTKSSTRRLDQRAIFRPYWTVMLRVVHDILPASNTLH